MSTRATILFAAIVIGLSTLAGLLLWDRLPEQMASHWNVNDEVDGYMSRFWGILLMPVVSVGLFLLFLIIPHIDPLKANIARFRQVFNLFIVLMVAFLTYLYILTLVWNLGYTNLRMSRMLLPAIGLLLIFIGYLLTKVKRNWFVGIRTPWTLSSDRVWDETHRIGAWLFIACGLLALLGAFFAQLAFWLVVLPILGIALFLIVYSYVLYRRETEN